MKGRPCGRGASKLLRRQPPADDTGAVAVEFRRLRFLDAVEQFRGSGLRRLAGEGIGKRAAVCERQRDHLFEHALCTGEARLLDFFHRAVASAAGGSGISGKNDHAAGQREHDEGAGSA